MALNCVAMVPVLNYLYVDYICTNYNGVFWCRCAVEEKVGVCQIILSEQTNMAKC